MLRKEEGLMREGREYFSLLDFFLEYDSLYSFPSLEYDNINFPGE